MPAYLSPDVHLYLHSPTPLFKARVNMASVTYPITSLIFDEVTLGAYTAIEPDMTLTLGSTEGADDLGRVRAQNFASSTAIPLGRVSQGTEDGTLNVSDNMYITVWDDFRVWSKLPFQDPNGVDYKDADIAVLTYMSQIPPVANCGPGFAGYITSGVITVSFDASPSYAMADGATITAYLWNVEDGTITVGSTATAQITVTFPAGFRWVGLTVTDSNGKVHTSRCPVLAVDPAVDVTIKNFAVKSHRLTQQGATIEFDIFQDAPRSVYPDGTLVMFWTGAPNSPSDRSHMKHIGWEQASDGTLRAMKPGLTRETSLISVDVAGRLDSLPGFPQALERSASVAWYYMPNLDINKCLNYLLGWHSTAMSLADFFLPATGASYPAMRLDSTGATLYDQINSRALSMTPDHILCCNEQGQLSVLQDWMYVDVGSRPAVGPILTEDDIGDISMPYARPPRVHVLRSSAVVASTSWVMLGGEETLPLAFSIAPGEAFSQGTSEQVEAEGLTQSQSQLNTVTGHRYARLNARFGPVRVRLLNPVGVWDFVPALMNRIQLNIGATYAAQRGLPFTTTQAMCKELVINYRSGKTGLAIEATATLELETSGVAAVTHVPESEGDPDDYETPAPPPPTEPPDFVSGQQQVVGIGLDGYVYKTTDFQTASGSGGPTWSRTNLSIAATIYSWVVDPFSPGYINGTGAINGWIVNDTDIYRVTDLFGSPAKASVLTFPTATSGASFHWRSIQASFGAYFAAGSNPWLLCVSYYGSTAGHSGTWVTRSTDGGVTWSAEVQISAYFSHVALTRFMPVGVYASPKTPGLAYTAAYVNASSGELPRWGEFADDGVFTLGATSSQAAASISYGAPPTDIVHKHLAVGPPTDTVRMIVEGTYSAYVQSDPDGAYVAGSASATLEDGGTAVTTLASDLPTTAPTGPDGITSGTFSFEVERATGTEWPVFSTTLTPSNGAKGTRLDMSASAQAGSGTVVSSISIVARVTEIELEDGTIYNPSAGGCALFKTTDWGATWVQVTGFIDPNDGPAGSIHIPWPLNQDEQLAFYGHFDNTTNHQFRLKKNQGATQSDVSPSNAGVAYGINTFGFAVRTYDNDRTYVAVGGIGNDTSSDPADDKVGLWVSDNGAATWTNILAPVAAVANAPRGLQIAFSGSDRNVLFAWGGKSDGSLASIYYSSNFGATLDSREGNMNSLGVATLIGIAGGLS